MTNFKHITFITVLKFKMCTCLPDKDSVETINEILLFKSLSSTSKHAIACESFDSTVVICDCIGLMVTAEEQLYIVIINQTYETTLMNSLSIGALQSVLSSIVMTVLLFKMLILLKSVIKTTSNVSSSSTTESLLITTSVHTSWGTVK